MLPLVMGAVALAKSPVGKAIGKAVGSRIARAFGRGVKKTAFIAGSTAIGAVAADKAINMFNKPAGGLPALPGLPGGGLPALPAPGAGGGSSGSLQKYGSKALTSQMPDMLDLSLCRPFYRAPKGYVIVRDPNTKQYVGAVRKDVAKRNGLWKPSAKPPISATEWRHYKDAHRVGKKLKKIAKSEFHHHRAPATSTRRCKKK